MAAEEGGLARIAGAFARVVQDPDAPSRIEADAAGYLREVMGAGVDADVMGEEGARRLLVYRKLVRRGIAGAIRAQMPDTWARLGATLDAWIMRWIDVELPASRYLRDTAGEFVAWAAPRWAHDETMPRWMGDFARHEVATFEVRAAVGGGPKGGDLELDRPAVFDGAARIVRYSWAVHRIPEGERGSAEPAEEPTALLLYRDETHDDRCLSLSPLAAALLERLFEGRTLRAALLGACETLGVALDDAMLRGTSEVLADLGERGVLLGARGEARGG